MNTKGPERVDVVIEAVRCDHFEYGVRTTKHDPDELRFSSREIAVKARDATPTALNPILMRRSVSGWTEDDENVMTPPPSPGLETP